MKHNEIRRSVLDRLESSRRLLEAELSGLTQALRPAMLGRSRIDQGQLGLCLSRCDRALSKFRELIDASTCNDADSENKQYAVKLEGLCGDAEHLLVHAREFQSVTLVVSEVEGNVIHLSAEHKREGSQCFEHMLKALEIDLLLQESHGLRVNVCPELKGIEGGLTLDHPLNRSRVRLKLV